MGFETDRTFEIWVDGERIAVERRPGPGGSEWVDVDYPLPTTSAAQSIVEFKALEGSAVVYGVRVIQLPEA
jgi:hypothetical protein